MTIFTIKLLACITMLIDHIALFFMEDGALEYDIMRSIGRLAFPLFAFALVEGFFHTSDLKKYILRLGLFAIAAELACDFSLYRFDNRSLEQLEIGVTLFAGILAVSLYHYATTKAVLNPIMANAFAAMVVIGFGILADRLRISYGMYGILLILYLYIFRGRKLLLTMAMLILSILFARGLQIFSVFSMIFISMYNGEKGKSMKYFFYAFYPAHLILLSLISH